jgi:DNA polymerase I-like protein with 3'-5' exonuclease and polymerase domains
MADSSNIRLLVQGAAPTQDDIDEGTVFGGKIGHWLRRNVLSNAGLDPERHVLYDNKGDESWNNVPRHVPRLLVGKEAAEKVLGEDYSKISEWHGHIQFHDGRLVGITYDPAKVRAMPNLLPVAIRETSNLLEAARNPKLLDHPVVRKGYIPYKVVPEFVTDLEWNPETEELIAVGVAYEGDHAFSTYDVEAGLEVVRQHLREGTRVIGHNLIEADIPKFGQEPKSYGPDHVIDTRVVGHLLHAHLAELGLLGLGDLVKFYRPTSQWKLDKQDLLVYNGRDSAYNFQLWKLMERDLTLTDQWHLVEKQQRLVRMSYLMAQIGIRLDDAALFEYARKRKEQRGELAASFPFNPNSPKQIKEWLKDNFGIRVTDTTFETLKKLEGRHPDIDRLIEYRDDTKSLTTWFPITVDKKTKDIIAVQSCVFPRFNPMGTAVARFSCSEPNYQNIPPHLRRFIVPRDKSLVLYGFDAKNIENRTVAYIAGDTESLQKWAEGYDPYTLTAMLMFRQSYDAIKADKKEWEAKNQKKKSMRERAKTTELASIYGETAFSLANRMFGNRKKESIAEATKLREAFFSGRPKIRLWHKEIETRFNRGEVMFRNPFGRVRFVYAQDTHEFMKRGAHFLGCSTAADIINQRALDIWDELGLLPILIVHDELVYELPRGEAGWKTAKRIKEIMERPTPELDGLVVPAEAKMGESYGTMQEVNLEEAMVIAA